MTRHLLLAALLGVSACAETSTPVPDPRAVEYSPPTIHELRFPNPSDEAPVTEVRRVAIEWRVVDGSVYDGFPCGGELVAECAYFSLEDDTCVVYAPSPFGDKTEHEHEATLRVIGHGLMHCYYGDFHPVR